MFTVVMDKPEDAGQRIAWARKRADISQQDLADAAGVRFQAISAWEVGRNKTVKSEFLAPLARALDVDLVWLLTGEGSPDRLHNALLEARISALSPEQQALITRLIESLKP